MNENELKLSTNYIKKLASLPDADERISLYLDSLFACYPQQKDILTYKKTAKKRRFFRPTIHTKGDFSYA